MSFDRSGKTSRGTKRSYSEITAPPPGPGPARMHPMGFPVASPEVLATRKFARSDRPQPPAWSAPNLFMGLSLATDKSLLPPVDYSKMDLRKSVNQAGLWQMGGERQKALTRQLPTFMGTSSPTSSQVRIGAVTQPTENWGISADENVRTEFQLTKRANMSKHEAETVFNQRSHQATLVWKTGSQSLSQYGDKTDTSQPLSGHTPAIKTQKVPGTLGALTKEHGTRDARREQIVNKTFGDAQRSPFDVPIMSKLATIQLFMSPKEELKTAQPQLAKLTTPVFSQQKDVGDISGSNSDNFNRLADRVQIVRETEKMHAARNLMISGYSSLVPQSHQQLLQESGGDVSGAMVRLHQESINPHSTVRFNEDPRSRATRLDLSSLREMDKDKTRTETPLSPVRRVAGPSFTF